MKLRGTLNKRDDEDKGWSVEGRIPWTDFVRTGGRPVPGEEWKLNLCRFDYHKDWKEPELSCVAPIAKKKIAAVLPPDRGLRDAHVRRPRRQDREAVRHREARAADDHVDRRRLPRPAAAVSSRRGRCQLQARVPDHGACDPRHAPRCSSSRSRGPTGRPRVSRFRFDATRTKDAVKLMDTPDEGTAYDIAFHPKFAENGYVYIGWNGEARGAEAEASQSHALHDDHEAAVHDRPEDREDDHRVGVGRPQRRGASASATTA